MLEKLRLYILLLKYHNKMEKLNISKETMKTILSKHWRKYFKDVINAINESTDSIDFKNKIIDQCSDKESLYGCNMMLFGTVLNKYDIYDFELLSLNQINLDNYRESDLTLALIILRNNFFSYVSNSNEIKNVFLRTEDGERDYTRDLDRNAVTQIFDDVINKSCSQFQHNGEYYKVIRAYIMKTIGIYGKDCIEQHIDFVSYDIMHGNDSVSLQSRLDDYLKLQSFNDSQIKKINEKSELIDKLKTIKLDDSKELVDKLTRISDSDISSLEDAYLEYETLFRRDIVDHLYKPHEDYIVIEDFRDLRPQLLHVFIRNPEKLRLQLEEELKNDIINSRSKPNESTELSSSEQQEYERRLSSMDTLIDPTQVNYSFNFEHSQYTDSSGFLTYHSDTSNQISGSLYSEKYFLNHYYDEIIGIGFNEEGLEPEAIALSSQIYLTTNTGLDNVEYNESSSFDCESSTYQELIENDGQNEIVMFRRNIDYDTKASYIFCTIRSDNPQKAEKAIEQALCYARTSKLPLVIYDLYKIQLSYQAQSKAVTSTISNDDGKTNGI